MLWSRSQSLRVQSCAPLRAYRAGQSTESERTPSPCPRKVCRQLPSTISHSFNVHSLPTRTSRTGFRSTVICGTGPANSSCLVCKISSSSATGPLAKTRSISLAVKPSIRAARSLTSTPVAPAPTRKLHTVPPSVEASTYTAAPSASQLHHSCSCTSFRNCDKCSRTELQDSGGSVLPNLLARRLRGNACEGKQQCHPSKHWNSQRYRSVCGFSTEDERVEYASRKWSTRSSDGFMGYAQAKIYTGGQAWAA
mmetsp:Transcript_51084/g.119588  ORF Transcript_51084/g.119588 Transcript_51084/m.119588 type:complete len:252 (-) Transcript_51084:30-785(-)